MMESLSASIVLKKRNDVQFCKDCVYRLSAEKKKDERVGNDNALYTFLRSMV